MLCVRRCSDAGLAGRVRYWQVQCREPKTGQQKVQLYDKDDPLCPSCYTVYLCQYHTRQEESVLRPIGFNIWQNAEIRS